MSRQQTSIVAASYAEALFRAARKQGILQRLQEECRVLSQVIKSGSGERSSLQVFIEDPQRPTEHKLELVDKVLKGRLNPLLVNLLRMLVERERCEFLKQILQLIQDKIEEAEGIFEAKVESAAELGFQEKLKLKAALEKFTNACLRLEYEVNPNLIGGLVFRFRDTLIDGSIQYGLQDLKRKMLEVRVLDI
jgi:F-type H+-transporting ATPase subunit delta